MKHNFSWFCLWKYLVGQKQHQWAQQQKPGGREVEICIIVTIDTLSKIQGASLRSPDV